MLGQAHGWMINDDQDREFRYSGEAGKVREAWVVLSAGTEHALGASGFRSPSRRGSWTRCSRPCVGSPVLSLTYLPLWRISRLGHRSTGP